ncbi:MAG: hypothetical protein QNJ72_24365 [Pleurocapsa sp. MO_226.B13]|nr:hypothetical protein [Pleurocapsa sp. MO_226.B13]
MATNNKAISAYIPPDLEEYLTKYCTEYDITRKDKSGEIKPALGTAVVEILKRFFSSENLPSPLPDNVPLVPSNVVTEDRLDEALSNLKSSSNVLDTLPSNVVTEDDLSNALSKIPSIVNEQVNSAIGKAMPKAIATLKSELQPILDAHTETLELLGEITSLVPELNTQHEDIPTITKVDKKSLDEIFESSSDELEATEKPSQDELEDEDSEEVNYNKVKVDQLRKLVTKKGLGKKFREKIGKSPRNARKAEIIKFLNETSIFDSD